jgi:hypothetical protein
VRRRVLWLTLGLALAATPAIATHVEEPTAPITGLYLEVLHYAGPQYIVPCGQTSLANPYPYPFVGARLRYFVDSDLVRPSEHFQGRIREDKARFGPGGAFQAWDAKWGASWLHSNVPPHAVLTPETRPVGGGGMWLANGDFTNVWYREPGVYRLQARAFGDESGAAFLAECYVEVPEGAAP